MLGLMLWAWVSSAAVLVGAVLNAELEQQAALRPSHGIPC
ncbi:hypothetical protein IBL25_11855 [Roseomonas ludipueritiae]|uniref:Uncharacterized protein n=1 Tax=Pseudoroseomonas ludipueritiae TaxID=198093 RepID=A0ABR7R790_9PROT|nr:hypothetical protein [Pseudoroseomonas ludipueritiae]